MSVKTFENNGKNISENIVKLKFDSLLYNHLIYICHGHSKQLFTGHLYDARAKTSDIVMIKMMTNARCRNQNTLIDLLFAAVVRN